RRRGRRPGGRQQRQERRLPARIAGRPRRRAGDDLPRPRAEGRHRDARPTRPPDADQHRGAGPAVVLSTQMAITVYSVPFTELLRLPGSGDEALLADIHDCWFADQADEFLEEAARIGDEEGCPTTLAEAVRRFIHGEPLVTPYAAMQAYEG